MGRWAGLLQKQKQNKTKKPRKDYELMKLYHPDSAQSLYKNHSSEILTSEIRQERLNVISAAYDALRGIKPIQPRWRPYSRTSSSSAGAGSSSSSGGGEPGRRRWTGRRNQWGGFEYEPQVQPHPDGLTEPFFLSKNGVLITLVVIVVSTVLSVRLIYISPTTIAARHHDEARLNLEEARRLGKEHGEERRQELRKWIDEGGMKGFGVHIGHGGPRSSSEHYGKLTARKGDVKPFEEESRSSMTSSSS